MMVDVVAAILENQEGKILIAKRKKGKQLAGFWEFPGGKIEKGESPQQCLIRELQEEMSLMIEVGDYVGENVHHYEEFTIRLQAYKARIIGGDLRLEDHDEYKWLPLPDLLNIALAPADIPLVESLLKQVNEC